MMSLPVWLPGPIFLLGRRVLCARSLVPSGGLCFWSHVPSKGSPSRESLSRGSVPDRDPETETPWTETPPGQRGSVQGGSLSGSPMDRNLPYSEERAVRILLEYFLVFTFDLFGPIWGGCLNIKLVR